MPTPDCAFLLPCPASPHSLVPPSTKKKKRGLRKITPAPQYKRTIPRPCFLPILSFPPLLFPITPQPALPSTNSKVNYPRYAPSASPNLKPLSLSIHLSSNLEQILTSPGSCPSLPLFILPILSSAGLLLTKFFDFPPQNITKMAQNSVNGVHKPHNEGSFLFTVSLAPCPVAPVVLGADGKCRKERGRLRNPCLTSTRSPSR